MPPTAVSVINPMEGRRFMEPEESLETSFPQGSACWLFSLALVSPTGGHCWHSGVIFPDVWDGKPRHRVGSKLLDLGTVRACISPHPRALEMLHFLP